MDQLRVSLVARRSSDFSFLHCIHTDSEAHLASYSVDERALSPGIKPQHEADQSPPSGADVKNSLQLCFCMSVWYGAS